MFAEVNKFRGSQIGSITQSPGLSVNYMIVFVMSVYVRPILIGDSQQRQ